MIGRIIEKRRKMREIKEREGKKGKKRRGDNNEEG